MNIRIFYENVKFRLRGSGRIKKFLQKVITEKKRTTGDLFFIFTGDDRIREINREFLGHDYYTDVISFDYCNDNIVNGEIYISIDSIRNNSGIYATPVKEEVVRVMIHGTLHLLGYNDSNDGERKKMMEFQEVLVKEFHNGQ